MQEHNTGEILFYKSDEGDIKINVIFQNETIWLSQKQIGDVFDTSKQNISSHIQNCFETGEILEEGTVKNLLTVQKEGTREVKREVTFYNLDVIIAVGYRVNSYKATKFRIWSNKILQEYVIKGFAMDDERLKNGNHFGKDYFDELLARIREIRASERRFYLKITDIYATSEAYDSKAQISKDFFAEVQNKFLYAVSGKTAGELEYNRVNANKPNMGLTSWKAQKTGGKIVKTDITIGKNYLSEEEISTLNLLISGYLDFAELQAKKGKVMHMQDWIDKTKNFLVLNDMEILSGKGKVSKRQADDKAEKEYSKFRVEQDKNYIGDFDKFVQEVNNKKLK
ncbi:MAG: virulence RhuM family protein [Candidatus Gracilibacteria bacterium]|nr:virulence RhuM family protein [Candidatus Gracilibacteria bacterium]MDQ7023453.1 virulence RhuM family protein [Candidatus Gracilibacteria bacterium]